ncbi:ABC transporter permease [Porphyromonadaceae bacterium W3.11]|nr:ABC transporter permease [Porphyromonadaceae bacterium W3.11]
MMSKNTSHKTKHKGANKAKQFKAFVHKEFIHILRDPYTLMILILMPIVEMLLFGFALNMDVTNLRTLVVDYSGDRYSHQITEKVRSNKNFILEGVTHDASEVDQLMKADKIDLAIVIPQHFERDISTQNPTEIQIMTDAMDPNNGKISARYASALIGEVIQDDIGTKSANTPIPMSISVKTRMLYNPTMHSSYNFVPGVMGLVLIILCTIVTSVSIAREKERGNMELLMASPANSTVMVLAKAVPYFVLSLINLATILLLSYYILGVPIRGSLLLIIFITMIYIFLSLAIGLAISSLVKLQRDAIIISGFGMMMPTIILGGMLFPIASMPNVLQWVSKIVPAQYYIEAIRKVMIQGLPFSGVWQEILILTLLAIGMIILAVINIRPRLR